MYSVVICIVQYLHLYMGEWDPSHHLGVRVFDTYLSMVRLYPRNTIQPSAPLSSSRQGWELTGLQVTPFDTGCKALPSRDIYHLHDGILVPVASSSHLMAENTDFQQVGGGLTPRPPLLPRVTIRFCTQCKWLLRAAYVSVLPFLNSP